MSKFQINLPKTAFSMKANLPIREPEFLKFWDEINLYKELRNSRKGQEKFTAAMSNAVVNYIYQNTMSHISDEQGNIINKPTEYGGYEVKSNSKLEVPTKVIDNVLYINYDMLAEDFSEGLRMTLLPAASAGPNFQQAILRGKFQGTIATTTPIGSRVTRPSSESATGATSP